MARVQVPAADAPRPGRTRRDTRAVNPRAQLFAQVGGKVLERDSNRASHGHADPPCGAWTEPRFLYSSSGFSARQRDSTRPSDSNVTPSYEDM